MKQTTKGLLIGLVLGGVIIAAIPLGIGYFTPEVIQPETQTFEISNEGYVTTFDVVSNGQLYDLKIFYEGEDITSKAAVELFDGSQKAHVSLDGLYDVQKITVRR